MKQIIEARYNVLFLQNGSERTLKLNPECEIIIIHTDGKKYVADEKKGGFRIEPNIAETRMFVTPDGLDELIQGLQRIRMSLKALENVSDVVNDVFTQFAQEKK
jgi:hypothetical protein